MEEDLVSSLPKAELHVHIEGTLEPELMFALAERNDIELPFPTMDAVRSAYDFSDLQSFLDVYYQGAAVLRNEADFADLAREYAHRAAADGVRHAEIFFDPQTHTERGIPMDTIIEGLSAGLADAPLSSELILCFLRHLSEDEAMKTLELALPYKNRLVAVGLDSSESGNPPERFARVFAAAREEGLRVVAHAGEEGPPEYVWQALDILGAERIDHGVRALEDSALVDRLARDQVPLTVCPLSNVKLRVVDNLENHPLPSMLERGLLVTINSDDPAYFGGYVGDNYRATATALQWSDGTLATLAANSIEASFLDQGAKRQLTDEIDQLISHSS